jgi:flagellar motor switch protein FliN/FliY
MIQAKVDGVPVFDCHYGTSNGRYAIKIDRMLTSADAGWLGDDHELNDTAEMSDRTAWPPNGPRRWPNQAQRHGHASRRIGGARRPRSSPTSRHPRLSAQGNDLNMILDIPVQLTVELGRTRIPIKHILQLAQGSVVELEALAGEPMDVLVNGYLIAQGEVVVVNDKFGIRLTDIVTPSERMRRSAAADARSPPGTTGTRCSDRSPLFVRGDRADPAGRAVAAQAHATGRRGQRQGPMRVVACLPLAPNQRLVTVEVGQGDERRWLVLGVSPAASARCTRCRRRPMCRPRRPAPARCLRNCCRASTARERCR